jgi:hypothetical protein
LLGARCGTRAGVQHGSRRRSSVPGDRQGRSDDRCPTKRRLASSAHGGRCRCRRSRRFALPVGNLPFAVGQSALRSPACPALVHRPRPRVVARQRRHQRRRTEHESRSDSAVGCAVPLASTPYGGAQHDAPLTLARLSICRTDLRGLSPLPWDDHERSADPCTVTSTWTRPTAAVARLNPRCRSDSRILTGGRLARLRPGRTFGSLARSIPVRSARPKPCETPLPILVPIPALRAQQPRVTLGFVCRTRTMPDPPRSASPFCEKSALFAEIFS